jgi:hypothetical protein
MGEKTEHRAFAAKTGEIPERHRKIGPLARRFFQVYLGLILEVLEPFDLDPPSTVSWSNWTISPESTSADWVRLSASTGPPLAPLWTNWSAADWWIVPFTQRTVGLVS